MKKNVFLLLLLFCTTTFAQKKLENYEPDLKIEHNATIVMKDGATHNAEIKLPYTYQTKSIQMDQNITLQAKDIAYIEYHHKNYPDKKYRLYYVPTNVMLGNNNWCLSCAEGKNVSILLRMADCYGIDEKGDIFNVAEVKGSPIDYIFALFPNGETKYLGTLYYKKGERKGNWFSSIFVYEEKKLKFWKKYAAKAFKADPALSKDIKEGRLSFKDSEEIVNRYTPIE